MKKLRLALSLPFYCLFRALGFPKLLPFNYTLSVTYRCNSRCKTCNIWRFRYDDEFTTDEWIRTIKSFGKSPFWITVSGGEPFLRGDLEKIVEAIADYNRPYILNIPTNGLSKNIPERVRKILEICDGVNVVINFSVDGIGREHDTIRGVRGNWDAVKRNYFEVKMLKRKYENLTVGVHTVISKWNVKRFKEIAVELIKTFDPDQYITEIAEVREEMKNAENEPTPSPDDYADAIDFLIDLISKRDWKGLAKITESMRIEYYKYVKNLYLGGTVKVRSFAGFASCQVTPRGDVWECAVYATNMGNLRDYDYDFRKLWKSPKADEVRSVVKKGHICPLANENYVNMLFDPKVVMRVLRNVL